MQYQVLETMLPKLHLSSLDSDHNSLMALHCNAKQYVELSTCQLVMDSLYYVIIGETNRCADLAKNSASTLWGKDWLCPIPP